MIRTLLFLIGMPLGLLAQYSVSSVPNPKADGSDRFVSDPDDIIRAEDQESIESICRHIRSKTQAEMAVVALESIGSATPADFAADLARTWGVGRKGIADGIVLLMVKDQRRVETWVGDGLQARLSVDRAIELQQQYMIPDFKAGDYSAGMLHGVEAIENVLAPTVIEDKDLAFLEFTERKPEEPNTATALLVPVMTILVADQYDKNRHLYDPLQLIDKQEYKTLNDSLKLLAKQNNFGMRIALLLPASNTSERDLDSAAVYLHREWKLGDSEIVVVYDSLSRKLGVYQNLPRRLDLVRSNFPFVFDRIRWLAQNDPVPPADVVRGIYDFTYKIWTSAEFREEMLAYKRKLQQKRAEKQQEEIDMQLYLQEMEKLDKEMEQRHRVGFFDNELVQFYLMLTLAVSLFVLIWIGTVVMAIKDPYKQHNLLSFWVLKIWMFLFPIPYIGLWYWMMQLRKKYRDAPRYSLKTGEPYYKLDEKEEDDFLEAGQETEEAINSIHYDVWATKDRDERLILPYPIWFSKYSRCPECKFKTYYQEYNRTITAATTYSSGTGERKYSCRHCGHSKVQRYTIPRLQERKSSSSSSSYRSSSSSSSSRSSWGGGGSSGKSGGSSW